jgi:hypothetical protein
MHAHRSRAWTGGRQELLSDLRAVKRARQIQLTCCQMVWEEQFKLLQHKQHAMLVHTTAYMRGQV